jgi:hypothetical protein
VFAVRNRDSDSRSVALRVGAEFDDPGDIELVKVYRNVIK